MTSLPSRRAAAVTWAAALAATLLPVAADAATAAAPPSVATAPVQARAQSAGFEVDGSLQALRQSTVAAQTSGNVLALAVKAGDRVRAGQLLARIDDRDAQAGLARGDAAVAQADAELGNARANAERTRDLRTQGFVSQAALDTADAQFKAVQAARQQALAARTQAALVRGFTTVTAPFDAIVLATQVEAGDLAAPGRALVTVYAPGLLRAVVQMPASRAAAARASAQVEVQMPDGQWVAPVSRTLLGAADAVSQTVEWRLDLAPAAAALALPGQSVRVRFAGTSAVAAASGTAARLAVPASAVLRRGELTGVYTVRGNHFVLKAVRLGADQGAAGIEVLAGLQAGERVALDPVRAGLAGAVAQ